MRRKQLKFVNSNNTANSKSVFILRARLYMERGGEEGGKRDKKKEEKKRNII